MFFDAGDHRPHLTPRGPRPERAGPLVHEAVLIDNRSRSVAVNLLPLRLYDVDQLQERVLGKSGLRRLVAGLPLPAMNESQAHRHGKDLRQTEKSRQTMIRATRSPRTCGAED